MQSGKRVVGIDCGFADKVSFRCGCTNVSFAKAEGKKPFSSVASSKPQRLNEPMAEENIEIRAAIAEDIPSIGSIVARSWQSTFNGLLPPDFLLSITAEGQQNRHERNFALQGLYYRVAVVSGGVVGFASWGPCRDASLSTQRELYAIFLEPSFERQGIGYLLFKTVISDAAKAGFQSIGLTALSVNPNLRFYLKLGGEEFQAKPLTLGSARYEQVGFRWKLSKPDATIDG